MREKPYSRVAVDYCGRLMRRRHQWLGADVSIVTAMRTAPFRPLSLLSAVEEPLMGK